MTGLEARDRRWTRRPNGALKFAWMRHLLKLRGQYADLFTLGDYQPLEVSGPHRDHLIAFARRRGRDAAVTVAIRSFAPFTDDGRFWPRADSFDGTMVGQHLFDDRACLLQQ